MTSAEERKLIEDAENKRKAKEAITEVNAQNQLKDGCGGVIQLVDITNDKIVQVRLKGGCNGCPIGNDGTLMQTIPAALRRKKVNLS